MQYTNFIFSSSLFGKKTFRWKERIGSSLSMRDSDAVLYLETKVLHLWQISYGFWWGFSCSSKKNSYRKHINPKQRL